MSNSITLAIKASQLKQNLPLTDPEQVVLKTKVVKEVEREEWDDNTPHVSVSWKGDKEDAD